LSALVPTIGLEVHCQLKTVSKMFCACSITHGSPPNTAVCPVCLGHPGALPVVNDEAVRLAVRAGTALGCTVHDGSVFARKHYFYPDLPKGYQISQFDQPICTEGAVHCEVEGERLRFELERIHMEEDAGKLTHDGDRSRVDWNRGGTPLIEIVGRPDIPSAEAAQAWMRSLHRVMTEAGVTTGDLEKGHFRCDANVSVGPPGGPLGTRVEIKNINSFRFLAKAITDEIARQRALIASGGRVKQSTRSWTGTGTVELRSKEDAADYRYFPDPDLGPVPVTQSDRDQAHAALAGVPLDVYLLDSDEAEQVDFQSRYGLSSPDAAALLAAPQARQFFEDAASCGGDSKAMANWVRGPLARWTNANPEEPRITPRQIVELEQLIEDGVITRDAARELFDLLCAAEADVRTLIDERGLGRVGDGGVIADRVEEIFAAHPDERDRLLSGEQRLLGFFSGQVMRAFDGRADAGEVRAALQACIERASDSD
jgi:aspartyl-tRNA(Asn)/glutamyl-tRNA(Gln) amidotransferase subunit B